MKFGLEQHIIDKLIAVFEQHTKVDKALVFGSRAKGNYRPDSDIDIAIKGQDLHTDDIIAMSVAFEENGITHKIDLINYGTINEPDLKDHIDRVGIELYSRWKECKLNDICTSIISGGTPLTSIKEYYLNGTIAWIKTKEVLNNKIYDSEYKISELGLLKSAAKLLPINSIIIAMYGDGDTAGRIAVNKIPLATNQACGNLIVDKEIADFQFVFYYLLNSYDELVYLKSGSGQQNLNLKTLKDFIISLPPLNEQTAIATILSSLDDKIDLLHRQNKTLEQLAETLFRQWFVEEAEESWEVVTLGQFVETNIRSISKNYLFNEIEYLDTSSLTKGIINETQTLFLKDAPSRAKRLVENNDILVSTVRPDQKHYGIINKPKENLVVSTGFCVISCTEINPYFVYLLLTSDEMTHYLHSIAEGSTSTYPSLKPSDIEKIEFQKPTENKLNEFEVIASDYWNKININQTQIRTLTKTRDTLLPKLMSGEVRVKI